MPFPSDHHFYRSLTNSIKMAFLRRSIIYIEMLTSIYLFMAGLCNCAIVVIYLEPIWILNGLMRLLNITKTVQLSLLRLACHRRPLRTRTQTSGLPCWDLQRRAQKISTRIIYPILAYRTTYVQFFPRRGASFPVVEAAFGGGEREGKSGWHVVESAAKVWLRDERTRPQDQFPAYRDTQLTLKACRQIGHQPLPHRHGTLPPGLCVRILEWFYGEDELRPEIIASDWAECSGTACRGGTASRSSRLGIFFFYSDAGSAALAGLSQFWSFSQRPQLFRASLAVKESSRTFEVGKWR